MAMVAQDSDSDFGYDFTAEEEELLHQLASDSTLATSIKLPPADNVVKLAIDAVPARSEYATETGEGLTRDLYAARDASYFAKSRHFDNSLHSEAPLSPTADILFPSVDLDQEVSYPDLNKSLWKDARKEISAADADASKDGRSPLQRFRTYPSKTLSVSDLISGAWCELQYWYTLTRLPGGRKRKTAAMRKGTKVHQKLEEQVHTRVKISITTKEDAFGLKLWNLVQGLRTLRDTGLTRELEVWGTVDGNIVAGIIDAVSYENPNPEFEEQLSSQETNNDARQSSLTDYFPPKKPANSEHQGPLVYLTDVKTKNEKKPVFEPTLRTAKIQLLLYHKFLSDMAAGKLNFMSVFRRHGLNPDRRFTDSFIAQIGGLHDEIFVDAPLSSQDSAGQQQPSTPDSEADSLSGPDLLKYRSLRELYPLIERELKLNFPRGEKSMGHMLRVEYIHSVDGSKFEQHDFPVSRQALETYLSKTMEWWRGERDPRGVDIEDSFKCQACDFAQDCPWRQDLDATILRQAQEKLERKQKAREKHEKLLAEHKLKKQLAEEEFDRMLAEHALRKKQAEERLEQKKTEEELEEKQAKETSQKKNIKPELQRKKSQEKLDQSKAVREKPHGQSDARAWLERKKSTKVDVDRTSTTS